MRKQWEEQRFILEWLLENGWQELEKRERKKGLLLYIGTYYFAAESEIKKKAFAETRKEEKELVSFRRAYLAFWAEILFVHDVVSSTNIEHILKYILKDWLTFKNKKKYVWVIAIPGTI